VPAVTDPDPLASALARNAEHREMLLRQAGGALSAGEAARRLGITCKSVDQRRRAGTLFALREEATGAIPPASSKTAGRFPAPPRWCAASPLRVRGARSTSYSPPRHRLADRTPLQALQDGDRDAVLRLVRAGQGDGFG
jgi:hypothetical protein